MPASVLKHLPLGLSTFAALRGQGACYVDKTPQIVELAQLPAKAIFLARPRRFGKSLLVSTFESLFKFGTRDFKGLAAEKLWNDQTYPVVHLDFSQAAICGTLDEFRQSFKNVCINGFSPCGFDYRPDDSQDCLSQLSSWLKSLKSTSLVLLIDEYDAPLTANFDKALFESVRSELVKFFRILNSIEGCLRFFFMTGITKTWSSEIFTAFESIEDITLEKNYSTLLGFTQEELQRSFAGWLDSAASALGLSGQDAVIHQMRRRYAGYCFDRLASTQVFNPWSILNFLRKPKEGMLNYWFASGGQSILLTKHLDDPRAFSSQPMLDVSTLTSSQASEAKELDAILMQAGYLSIQKALPGDKVLLGYPNDEVSVSLGQLYADHLFEGKDLTDEGVASVASILEEGSVEDVVALLSRLVQVLENHGHPLTDDVAVCGMLQALIQGADLPATAQVQRMLEAKGLTVKLDGRCWDFVFRVAHKTQNPLVLQDEAVEQIRQCHDDQEQDLTNHIGLALVYSLKDKAFTHWAQVP